MRPQAVEWIESYDVVLQGERQKRLIARIVAESPELDPVTMVWSTGAGMGVGITPAQALRFDDGSCVIAHRWWLDFSLRILATDRVGCSPHCLLLTDEAIRAVLQAQWDDSACHREFEDRRLSLIEGWAFARRPIPPGTELPARALAELLCSPSVEVREVGLQLLAAAGT